MFCQLEWLVSGILQKFSIGWKKPWYNVLIDLPIL